MGHVSSGLRFRSGLISVVLMLFSVPSAFALSEGCSAVNALSGATSLSFGSHHYPASDFAAGDSLTLSFTDSGAAADGNPVDSDSISLAAYNLAQTQTYSAANSTNNSSHTVSVTVPAGSLEIRGLRVRANTSHGQISDLVFHCVSASSESDSASP